MDNSEFIKLKNKIKNKKINIDKIQYSLNILTKDLNKDIEILQSVCKHKFTKVNMGNPCYSEYKYICIHCNLDKFKF